MQKLVMIGALVLGGFGLLTGPVSAHHAFSAEFDADKPVLLQGTVVKVEWINPHTWIHIQAKDSSGKVIPAGTTELWMIECGNPNNLFRRGFTKEILAAGTAIVVDGYRAKNGSKRANGRDLRLPDGRTLFLGSSGTGAPYDPDAKK